nr:CPm [Pineapple mealybug wilt-associated virus 2]
MEFQRIPAVEGSTFRLSDKLDDKRKYIDLDNGSLKWERVPHGERYDAYVRAITVDDYPIDMTKSDTIELDITVFPIPTYDTTSGYIIHFEFIETQDKCLRVGLGHNTQYLGRQHFSVKSVDGNASSETMLDSNFVSNSWLQSSYKILFSLVVGRIVVKIDNYYVFRTPAVPQINPKILRIVRTLRSTNSNLKYGTVTPAQFAKFGLKFGTNVTNVDESKVRHRLVPPDWRAFMPNRQYVDMVPDESLDKDVPVPIPSVQTNTNATPSAEAIQELNKVLSADKIIESRGKAILEFLPNATQFNEADIYDERYLDEQLSLKVNTALSALCVELMGDKSRGALETLIIAMIQLCVTYSTVKNMIIKKEYYVETTYNGKLICVSYLAIRSCIDKAVGSSFEGNALRQYMRYFTYTTVYAMRAGLVTPNYSAAAKHGVPKRFINYSFDYCMLDPRYSQYDELKAASLAHAYAIKLKATRGSDSEVYNTYSLGNNGV